MGLLSKSRSYGSELVALVVMVVVLATVGVLAQEAPACATKLVPCVPYLNSTDGPPRTCCIPLREAVTNELSCLCNVYNNPSFRGAGVDVGAALSLPKRCGITNVDITQCTQTKAAPSPTAGGTPGISGSSDAWRSTSTCISSLTALLLLSAASIMA